MNNAVAILVPELASHLTVARDIEVGDLAVFTDYLGREVGARIQFIDPDGSVVGRVSPGAPAPYKAGISICRDREFVRRAI